MDIETSYNFRKIHDRLTTSGVVSRDCLKTLAVQGYEVLVNLMPDESEYAVSDEQRIVMAQNLEYIYIPVDFEQPEDSDFIRFSAELERVLDKDRKVHIHCAANYRVSAFCALYAVHNDIWSIDKAWSFIHDVWQPADHRGWSEFIIHTLTNKSGTQQTAPAAPVK
ncbi:MAG: protein tyrosine phosphatase family protein [Desulfobacter sp.]|nr:MAG: protein tyrosine phosphatase family protein [Desulfobacter sp.]